MWSRVSKKLLTIRKKSCLSSSDNEPGPDCLVWSVDLMQHCHGEISFAVCQANEFLEDHSQVEVGQHATFVGVYDGHDDFLVSRFVRGQLFSHLLGISLEQGAMSEDIIKSTFFRTEMAFLDKVREKVCTHPEIVTKGTCVLVGLIWHTIFYVANLGDSRAVMGSLDNQKRIVSQQLTRDHNVEIEEVRREVISMHPDDPDIVVSTSNGWRVKGLMHVSRSIGDAYLKSPEFKVNDPQSQSQFHLSTPIDKPVLPAEPDVFIRDLRPTDRFVIFASDGLWEHLTKEQAVKFVHRHPREGIARRLIDRAVEVGSRKKERTGAEVRRMAPGARRKYHDDITVVVLFINHESLANPFHHLPEISVRGNVNRSDQSTFCYLRGYYASATSATTSTSYSQSSG